MKNISIRFKVCTVILFLNYLSMIIPVKAQTNADGSAPQFLYSDFTRSKVRFRNGQFQSIMLNYNTVSEKMVYQKDNNLYDMVNTEMVDTVFMQDSKFVPASNVFFEILLAAPVTLFVQYQGELVPPGTPAGYGVNSQVSNTKNLSSVQLSMGYYNLKLPKDFSVKTDLIYWVRKDGKMFSFVNEKQFLKLFPDRQAELKHFIKLNKIKFDRLSDVVKLAELCNQSIL